MPNPETRESAPAAGPIARAPRPDRASLAAIRTQFRLVWGALGLLVTVLITVFGFLFTQ